MQLDVSGAGFKGSCVPTIFAVIISKNSWKSMVPLPSLSMSLIIFLISSFFGSKPRARIATFNSFASIVPASVRRCQETMNWLFLAHMIEDDRDHKSASSRTDAPESPG